MVERVESCALRLPLKRPFHSAGGSVDARELALVRIHDDEGRVGLGEITPYPDPRSPSLSELLAVFESERERILEHARHAICLPPALADLPPAVAAAIDTALLDLLAKRDEMPFWNFFGGAALPRIAVNATITAQTPEDVADAAEAAITAGFTTIKLKVGFTRRDDQRLAALREAVPEETLLRLDANGAWFKDEACETIERWQRHSIELIEQPVPSEPLADLKAVRDSSMIPVVADEGVRTLPELEQHIDQRACDGVAIKLAAAGGPTAAEKIIERAHKAGLVTFITSTLDGAVGLAAGIHFAGAFGFDCPAHGLATGDLFAANYARGLPTVIGGEIELPTEPGLGVTVDEDALSEFAIS